MAENSKIEWTDHTINFWWGCEKVSPACANCYAEGQAARFHAGLWGKDGTRRIRVEAAYKEALRYERQAVAQGRRYRVFTNSMSDFFEDRRDLDLPRLEALDTIRLTPHLDWLILTKRPEKVVELLARAQKRALEGAPVDANPAMAEWLGWWLSGKAPANVWLGTTVESQEWADKRIPALLQVPAAVRFLSCEPLLGPVDLRQLRGFNNGLLDQTHDALTGYSSDTPYAYIAAKTPDPFSRGKLDWVICGGESGPHARPMHPDWARGLRDQCAEAGVPFLFKQHGEWQPIDQPWKQDNPKELAHNERWMNLAGGHGYHGEEVWRMRRVGKKAAGRLLDGVEHNGYPEVARG